MNNINLETVMELLQTVDTGLCSGVGEAVRKIVIGLNDSNWSSNEARAEGLRKLAVAQSGSDTLDQNRFLELVVLKTIKKLCPLLFSELAEMAKTDEDREAMKSAGRACAEAESPQEAVTVLNHYIGRGIDIAHDRGCDLALARTFVYNLDCDLSLAIARARALVYPLVNALNRILDPTSDRDEAFALLADTILEVLVEMDSPGCQWLWLCENQKNQ